MRQINLDLAGGVPANTSNFVLLTHSREHTVPTADEDLTEFIKQLQSYDHKEGGLFVLIPVTENSSVEGRVCRIKEENDLPTALTFIVVKGDQTQRVAATITYDKWSNPKKMTLKVTE